MSSFATDYMRLSKWHELCKAAAAEEIAPNPLT